MQLPDSHTISADHAPGPEGAAPEACPIVALSDDPLLLEALAGLSVAGTGVMSSPSSDRFIDQLVANSAGAGIAIIDAAANLVIASIPPADLVSLRPRIAAFT